MDKEIIKGCFKDGSINLSVFDKQMEQMNNRENVGGLQASPINEVRYYRIRDTKLMSTKQILCDGPQAEN